MDKPRKKKAKKPRRNGVPIQFYLSDKAFAVLEEYRAHFLKTHRAHISKTDIGEQAFRDYLKSKGFDVPEE